MRVYISAMSKLIVKAMTHRINLLLFYASLPPIYPCLSLQINIPSPILRPHKQKVFATPIHNPALPTMPPRTITINLNPTWPEPFTIIKSLACGIALTGAYHLARTGSLPSPPAGFTWRGMVGGGIFLGGTYAVAGTMAENDEKRESTSRERLVMTRWIVGGLGLAGLGLFMLVRPTTNVDGAGCDEAVCATRGDLVNVMRAFIRD